MAAFDDLDLLSHLGIVDGDPPRPGISLGSRLWIEGVCVEDSVDVRLSLLAQRANWRVVVVERLGRREFWAAIPPTIDVYATHLGEGDAHPLGECPLEHARAVVRALNLRDPWPSVELQQRFSRAAAAVEARWKRGGKPYYTAVPDGDHAYAIDGEELGHV